MVTKLTTGSPIAWARNGPAAAGFYVCPLKSRICESIKCGHVGRDPIVDMNAIFVCGSKPPSVVLVVVDEVNRRDLEASRPGGYKMADVE